MADTTDIYVPMYSPGHMLENGKYRLERMLGEGQFAEVWLATDTADGSHVAIKIKKWRIESRITIGRFEDEKTVAMKLSKCPYIIAALGFLRWTEGTQEMLAIVYEYIEGGETLRDRIFTYITSEYEALRMTSEILMGLIAAHDEGVIHRDLKPENVLVNSKKKPPRPMIGDFGIAAVSNHSGDRRTRAQTQFGTPQYTAPEQWIDVRNATPRSDLFSLGVMLAELLGVPSLVTDKERVQIMMDNDERIPWLNRITNPKIRAIVQMATENEFENGKVVERRFSSATIMLVAVEAVMAEMSQDEPPWTMREAPESEQSPAGLTVVSDGAGGLLEREPEHAPRSPFLTIIRRDSRPAVEDKPVPDPPRRGWIGIMAGVVTLIVIVAVVVLWPKGKPEVPELPKEEVAKMEAQVVDPPRPEPPVIVTPKKEPKPEPPIVTPTPKVEVTPVVKVEAKPKADPKPVAKPIATPPPEEPQPEVAKVTTATATITTHPETAKVGDRIEIAAKVAIPDGGTVKSTKLYYKGDSGAYQNLTATFDGATAKATIPIAVGFGAAVTYYIDVRLEGDSVPHKSAVATTTITQ